MNRWRRFIDEQADPSRLEGRLSGRAAVWQLRSRTLRLPAVPLLMGIINVTPDSFSDGGRNLDRQAAIDTAHEMAAAGADLIDIGGESTRPYSQPVSEQEELARVVPVVQKVCEQVRLPVSIDTSKAAVARETLAAGAEIINDVTALAGDRRMLDVALESGAGVCVMHMQGTPQTMQDNPTYGDVVSEIAAWLADRRAALVAAGMAPERICIDPGIGFGKTHQHNVTLLANCHRFVELGAPVLVGHSRKSFIAKITGNKKADRTAGGIGVALSLASQGVQILRVHDIAPVRDALLLYWATGGIDGTPLRLDADG
jgi:dihydropteroate synthase